MKRIVLGASGLLLVAGALSTAGCASPSNPRCWFLKGNCLTYEQYLSIDQAATPAPTSDTVLSALGMPMAVHDRNGYRRRIDYHCYSLTGDLKIAEFTFDQHEKLTKKELW